MNPQVPSLIPANDAERIAALRRYRLLDTGPEASFDTITSMMAEVFNVPLSFISLVDEDRVFYKSSYGGFPHTQVPRKDSLCSYTILNNGPLIIENAQNDPCFSEGPYVAPEGGIRFYAGVPLITKDGFAIGTVCIVDTKPRSFSEAETRLLERFAWMASHEIETHQLAQQQVGTEKQLNESNEELRFVTDLIPQLVWATHPDGYSYYFNSRWLEYTGLSFDDVKGDGWTQSLHPDDREATFASWRNAVEQSVAYDVEYRLRRSDGVYRWFMARGTPMKDEAGRIVRWYGTTTDIDDQKRAEEELERKVQERTRQLTEAQEWAQAVLRHSPSGITVTEVIRDANGTVVDGRTILSNEAAERHTGMPAEQAMSGTIGEAAPGILESPLFQQALHTLRTGEPFITQYYVETTGRWIELAVARMDEERLINVFTDVTPIKEAQLRQDQLVERLKRSNEELEQFTYVSHHDLQEPLRKILMFTDMVKADPNSEWSEAAATRLEKVSSAARRMSAALRDVLNFASLNRQEEPIDTDLDEVLAAVQSDLELVIQEKKARVTSDALPTVRAIPHQMHQLFYNLLNNALKFARPGEDPALSITCRELDASARAEYPELRPSDRYYALTFRDNGIGFNPGSAEKIFGMFQRLHARDSYAGTGIGLALCRKVVQNHGGKIWAESAPDQGAAFHVLLPGNPDPLSPAGGGI